MLRTSFQRIQQSVQTRRWQHQQQQYAAAAAAQQQQQGGYPYDPNGAANPHLRSELFDGRTQSSRQNLSVSKNRIGRDSSRANTEHIMHIRTLKYILSTTNTSCHIVLIEFGDGPSYYALFFLCLLFSSMICLSLSFFACCCVFLLLLLLLCLC